MSKTHSMANMLMDQRKKLEGRARTILDTAEAEKRDLNAAEVKEFDQLNADMVSLRERTDKLVEFRDQSNEAGAALEAAGLGGNNSGNDQGDVNERSAKPGEFVHSGSNQPAALRSGQDFAQHSVVAAYRSGAAAAETATVAQYGSLGGMLRALSTTGSSAVIPETWHGNIIDLARNKSAVLQAGAQIVPMESKTVHIARMTSDPTTAFRTEASSITASDPGYDNVILEARTQSALVVVSMEWLQDSIGAGALVESALAAAIAQKIDLAALYGGITTGAGTINLPTPPNPRGILAALQAIKPAHVLGSAATDGTTQTLASFYGEVLDTIFTVKDANETPNAMIWNTKLSRQYAKATSSDYQPLQAPSTVTELQRFDSNQLPSYTKGTMTTATDLFVGDFTKLLVGQRLGLTIQVLTEKYADTGEVGIVAHWRGDIQPARPGAFAVHRALKGA